MGLDVEGQAVPEGCQLLRRSLVDPDYGEFLTLSSCFRRRDPQPAWRGADAEFRRDMQALLDAVPGLEHRRFDLERSWDAVQYAISPARRSGRESDLGSVAVEGERGLAPHLICGQGVPLRYTPPARVEAIAEYLSSTDFRAGFDYEELQRATIYKHHEPWTPSSWWAYIDERLKPLRACYQAAAQHGEGILVWTS